MSWVAVAIGGSAVVGAGTSMYLDSKNKKPEEPKEIGEARKMLLEYARTGQYGKFTAGAEVPLEYGDYGMTGLESQGQSKLQGLLSSGIPDQYKMGDAALQDLLATSPEQINRQFDPFKGQVQRQITDSNTALKRTAGFGGNLYSTNTIKGLGDIEARGNETLTGELARLTNQSLDRRLQAIPLAYQSGAAQEDIAMGRIGASQQYGGLSRQLNDAKIKARDAELLRRREELQLPIQAFSSLAGTPLPVEKAPAKSPYADLLQLVGSIGGSYLANKNYGQTPSKNSTYGTDNFNRSYSEYRNA